MPFRRVQLDIVVVFPAVVAAVRWVEQANPNSIKEPLRVTRGRISILCSKSTTEGSGLGGRGSRRLRCQACLGLEAAKCLTNLASDWSESLERNKCARSATRGCPRALKTWTAKSALCEGPCWHGRRVATWPELFTGQGTLT